MPELDMDIRGLVETRRKMRQVADDVHGPPIVQAIRESALMVERDAKIAAPVDRGNLRNSITSEIRATQHEALGIVGSNVKHAPYMEYGTGTFVGKAPHYPPMSALRVWARRHGMHPFLVARAIGRAGGLKPRLFLTGAFEKNEARIEKKIDDAVRGIVEE